MNLTPFSYIIALHTPIVIARYPGHAFLMARKSRISLPGIPQHVIQRGNNRQACFFNKGDCHYFLDKLRDSLRGNGCQLHAFVLMSNHVHLLVTASEPDGVSRMMMDLGRSYVRFFNDTYGRTGTLWEGRFKSSMVDSERYCLACYRYIELNPVVANMAAAPDGYPWSSYHTNALGKSSDLIEPHPAWTALGCDQASRQQAYLALFEEKLATEEIEAIRYGVRKELPVGSDAFKKQIEESLSIKLGTGKRGRVKGVRFNKLKI